MGRKGGWIAAVMLALLAGPARADIYAFTDASGIMHFSDVPDDSRYALFLRTPKPAGTGAATGATPAAAPLREHYRGYIDDAARTYQVEAALLRAVISAESGYDPRAVSPRGAMGLMQLMPDTARRYGVADPYDPAQSIRGGAQYLRDLLRLFGNDLKLALAAYNAGEKAVVRYGRRIPPYRETRAYVPSWTVLLKAIMPDGHAAARAARKSVGDRSCDCVAKRSDGVWYVTLRSLGVREGRNPGVRQTFLVQRSFFWDHCG